MNTEHLLFAIGTVTTGPDFETDRVLELAAVVVLPRSLEDESFVSKLTFQSLVRPDAELPKQVSRETGITVSVLDDQPSFSVVFTEFFDWLQSVVREARRKTTNYLISALVSHIGFWTDFRFLLQEIDRSLPKSINEVIGLWCQFSDSWELLSRLKRMECLEKNTKTSLEDAYKKFCSKDVKGVRAMHKADALADILRSPAIRSRIKFADFLTLLAYRTWCEKERPWRIYFDDLLDHLGLDSVSVDLMQTLSYKRLTFQDLSDVYWRSRNSVHFRLQMKTVHAVNLQPDEATELYYAVKASSKSCGCFWMVSKRVLRPRSAK